MASRSKSLELVRGSDTEHVPQHLSCTLECEHLSYWVDARTGRSRGGEAKQLLRNVSIRVAPGEILAIIGPSGAGKSTLLDVLAYRKKEGFLRGRITLNGNDLPARLEDSIDYRRNTGFVSQGDLHLPGISVRETISFTASLRLDADASPEVLFLLAIARRPKCCSQFFTTRLDARGAGRAPLVNVPPGPHCEQSRRENPHRR